MGNLNFSLSTVMVGKSHFAYYYPTSCGSHNKNLLDDTVNDLSENFELTGSTPQNKIFVCPEFSDPSITLQTYMYRGNKNN